MTSVRSDGFLNFAAFIALAVVSFSARKLCADSVQEAQKLLDEKGNQLLDNDLKVIGEASELTELDLSQCGRITDKGLIHLTGLTQLRTLSLMGCRRITADGLAQLQSLKSLESLSLERIGPALKGLPHLKELPNLRSLDVSDNNTFRGEGLEELTQLTSLNAACSRGAFNDKSLERLAGLTKLEHLNLNGCDQITDRGLPQLESLAATG